MIEADFDKIFDTQQIYRLTLDAMARPGKVYALPAVRLNPPAGLNKAAAAVALTLLDSETAFCVLPSDEAINDYLIRNTGAVSCQINDAEFIVTNGKTAVSKLSEACCGTLFSPEKGATLITMVDSLVAAHSIKLRLSGPGIKDGSILNISGMAGENMQTIFELNREYPLGVDVIYADKAGNVACVPRSSALQWEVLS